MATADFKQELYNMHLNICALEEDNYRLKARSWELDMKLRSEERAVQEVEDSIFASQEKVSQLESTLLLEEQALENCTSLLTSVEADTEDLGPMGSQAVDKAQFLQVTLESLRCKLEHPEEVGEEEARILIQSHEQEHSGLGLEEGPRSQEEESESWEEALRSLGEVSTGESWSLGSQLSSLGEVSTGDSWTLVSQLSSWGSSWGLGSQLGDVSSLRESRSQEEQPKEERIQVVEQKSQEEEQRSQEGTKEEQKSGDGETQEEQPKEERIPEEEQEPRLGAVEQQVRAEAQEVQQGETIDAKKKTKKSRTKSKKSCGCCCGCFSALWNFFRR